MYSYLHKYHAGNFADVHKHIILLGLIEYLKKKPKPFGVLDAFAGDGEYNLNCSAAQLNKEYEGGIGALYHGEFNSELAQQYVQIVRQFNSKTPESVAVYPGSPRFISQTIRDGDKGILIENHATAYNTLHECLKKTKNIHLHQRDAFEGIPALVPMKEKRGLIFIDPSYENKSEYSELPKTIEKALEKMPNAMIAVWYPLLEEARHLKLIQAIKKQSYPDTYFCEWRPYPALTKGMLGSGLFIINNGWGCDLLFKQTFLELNEKVFKQGKWQQSQK